MCGRGRCTLKPGDVAAACAVDLESDGPDFAQFRPSYNVSPGAYLPVIAKQKKTKNEGGGGGEGEGKGVLKWMKWGLIPSFTNKNDKPDHYRMFNARSESIKEKPSFRRLVSNNRCVVAMEGFYEWKKDGSKKQPYYIYFKDGRPLVFAALYDCWHNAEGESIYTFTILTTSSSSKLQWLHDRMPVILGDKSSIGIWLNGSASESDSVAIPYEGPDLVWHPVTASMGKPSFDGPECIKEIPLKPSEKGSLIKFLKKPVAVKDVIEVKKEEDDSTEGKNPTAVVYGIEDVKKEEDDSTEGKNLTAMEYGIEDMKKEEDENTEGRLPSHPLDQVQESKTEFGFRPKKEEESIKKKRGSEKIIFPPLAGKDLKKQRGPAKNDGGERTTLFSYFDSKSAIAMAKNPVHHDRTKHARIDRHYIKEKIDSGIIRPEYVSTVEQTADMLTKGLPGPQFQKLLKLGMMNIYTQLEGEC